MSPFNRITGGMGNSLIMPTKAKPPATEWAFRARFRRAAFGRAGSKLAISRIDEALSEIRAVARHDPAAAAEGAVLLLEKLSPALSQVDSSSGALGNATYGAVQALVPIIAEASVSDKVRSKWLDRLFAAIQDDDPPYIESLGDYWGELCVTAECASRWADDLVPMLRRVQEERKRGVFAWMSGAGVCYSALFKAGRHDELFELLDSDRNPIWPYRVWGGRVFLARGQVDEAIAYMAGQKGDAPLTALAAFAEDALLKVDRRAEAYQRYAIDANQANSRLATFRAIAKKYPEIGQDQLLSDLIKATPGDEGKWFATAKSLKRFDLATGLAWHSPCDPKTLTRAARDHLVSQPAFAVEVALASLHWLSLGHGYDLTAMDALDAHRFALEAAQSINHGREIEARIMAMLAEERPMAPWLRKALRIAPSSRTVS
jgi:hypothetical protein